MTDQIKKRYYLRNAEATPRLGNDNAFDIFVIEGTQSAVASLMRRDMMVENAALSFTQRGRKREQGREKEEFEAYLNDLRGARDAYFAGLNPVRICNVSVHADFRSCLLDWEGPEPSRLRDALERISRSDPHQKLQAVVLARVFMPASEGDSKELARM